MSSTPNPAPVQLSNSATTSAVSGGDRRLPYEAPVLHDKGAVDDLTRSAVAIPGADGAYS